MHRGFYVGFVLTPLLLGLIFLVFALSTEYWTSLDYSRVKDLHNNLTEYQQKKNYVIKHVRLEFPKYSGLFGECNEYKKVEVLEPVSVEKIVFLMNGSSADNTGSLIKKYTYLEHSDLDAEARSERDCLTLDECNQLKNSFNDTCFCCESVSAVARGDGDDAAPQQCCHLKSKLCDGVRNCKDRSDEIDNCPIRKLFYSTQYYDNDHECLRNKYHMWRFTLNVFDRYILKSGQDRNNSYCLRSLMNSQSYSVRLFSMRVVVILSLLFCVFFSILALITLLCVICCNNLQSGKNKKLNSVDQINELNYGASDDEGGSDGAHANDQSRSSSNRPVKCAGRNCCCRCNCLLCPFVFYSIFTLLAFLSILFGFCVYLYSTFYTRNIYLIYDLDFLPDYMTRAYQHNPWLFDVQKYGISFYALLIAVVFYLLAFIITTWLSCFIQMSPSWRTRGTESSYEVLEMHDIVFNKKKAQVKKSNSYIKLCKEGGSNTNSNHGTVNKNSDLKPELKREGSKEKTIVNNGNKYVNLTNSGLKCPEAQPEDDESGAENQGLTTK